MSDKLSSFEELFIALDIHNVKYVYFKWDSYHRKGFDVLRFTDEMKNHMCDLVWNSIEYPSQYIVIKVDYIRKMLKMPKVWTVRIQPKTDTFNFILAIEALNLAIQVKELDICMTHVEKLIDGSSKKESEKFIRFLKESNKYGC